MSRKDQSGKFNRRELLKASSSIGLATAGFTAASGAGSATSNNRGGNELDSNESFNVVDTADLSESKANEALKVMKQSEHGSRLIAGIEGRHDLEEAGVAALQGITDNEKIEERNPVVVLLGLEARENAPGSAGGLIYGVIGETSSGERDLLMSRGLVSEASDDISIQHADSNSIEVLEYVPDSNGAALVSTRELELPSDELSSDGVSTQSFHKKIGATVCVGAVATLCEIGGGSVTRTQCVPACTTFGPSGPVGYTACLAFCAYAVKVIQSRGCSIGASALCTIIFSKAG